MSINSRTGEMRCHADGNVSGFSDSSADPTYDGEEKRLQLYCLSLQ